MLSQHQNSQREQIQVLRARAVIDNYFSVYFCVHSLLKINFTPKYFYSGTATKWYEVQLLVSNGRVVNHIHPVRHSSPGFQWVSLLVNELFQIDLCVCFLSIARVKCQTTRVDSLTSSTDWEQDIWNYLCVAFVAYSSHRFFFFYF